MPVERRWPLPPSPAHSCATGAMDAAARHAWLIATRSSIGGGGVPGGQGADWEMRFKLIQARDLTCVGAPVGRLAAASPNRYTRDSPERADGGTVPLGGAGRRPCGDRLRREPGVRGSSQRTVTLTTTTAHKPATTAVPRSRPHRSKEPPTVSSRWWTRGPTPRWTPRWPGRGRRRVSGRCERWEREPRRAHSRYSLRPSATRC